MEIGCGKRTEGSSAPSPRTDERMGGWRATCFPPPPVHHPFSARYTVPSPPFFLPLFLPLSRVISSFTFLVSTSSSHPPSRAPLTAFSRFPTLIYLDLDPLSILSVYVGMHARRTPWEFVLGRAFNDTSEKFWGREREREEEEPCSIAFFSFRGSFLPPLRREQRPWEIFNRPRRLVGEKFLLRAELCTGTVHNVYIRTVGGGGSVKSGKEIFKRGVVVHHPSTFSPVASCPPPLLLLLLLPLYGWKGESTIVDRLEKHPRRKRNWRILNISRCNKARHATDRLRYWIVEAKLDVDLFTFEPFDKSNLIASERV